MQENFILIECHSSNIVGLFKSRKDAEIFINAEHDSGINDYTKYHPWVRDTNTSPNYPTISMLNYYSSNSAYHAQYKLVYIGDEQKMKDDWRRGGNIF